MWLVGQGTAASRLLLVRTVVVMVWLCVITSVSIVFLKITIFPNINTNKYIPTTHPQQHNNLFPTSKASKILFSQTQLNLSTKKSLILFTLFSLNPTGDGYDYVNQYPRFVKDSSHLWHRPSFTREDGNAFFINIFYNLNTIILFIL